MRRKSVTRRVAVEGGAIELRRAGGAPVAITVTIREGEKTVDGGLPIAAAETIRAVRRVEPGAKLGHVFAAIAVTIVITPTGGGAGRALSGHADHHAKRDPWIEVAAVAVP